MQRKNSINNTDIIDWTIKCWN